MTDLAKLVVRLEAQTAQYMQQLDAATRKLDRFAKSSEISAKNIAVGLASAAVTAGVAFGALAKAAIDHGDALDEMSQKTGTSVESLSRLEYAAKFSSVSLDDLGTAEIKLSKQMKAAAEGSKDAVNAFKAIGVSVKNADGTLRNSEDVLLDIADRFSNLEDGAGKGALSLEYFGKAGAGMIPFLNLGRQGIADLAAEADALGVTMSGDTAKAAGEFNDTLDRIKGATSGLGNTFIEHFLPTLMAIAESFVESAKQGGYLNGAMGVLSVTFKSLVTAGIIVKSVFQTLGRLIYGVGESLLRVAQGQFRMAGQALKDAFNESKEHVSQDIETINKVWATVPVEAEKVAEKTNKAMKKSIIFNDKVAQDKATKAADAAIKSLRDMKDGLDEQVATFGKGEVEATKYRLTVGSLSDKVKAAGATGKELADAIISQAEALSVLENQDAIANLDAQIKQLTGDTAAAAGELFDLQNKVLSSTLAAQGNTAGQEALKRLRAMTVAQAEYNKLEEQSAQIKSDLAMIEEQIEKTRSVGAISELDSLKQLDEARSKAVTQLQAILDKQKEIAATSGNSALAESAKKAQEDLMRLNKQTDLFVEKLRTDITGILEDGIYTAMEEGFSKGAKSALKSFMAMLDRMAAQAVAAQLAQKIFGDAGTGGKSSLGGWAGKALDFVGGLFGGKRDSGGRGSPGQAYLIGTGAQPEMFVPDSPGTFHPRDTWMGGGKGTVNNIYVSGRPDQRTARQMAVEMSRSQRIAMARVG
jgi:hypothetical protein